MPSRSLPCQPFSSPSILQCCSCWVFFYGKHLSIPLPILQDSACASPTPKDLHQRSGPHCALLSMNLYHCSVPFILTLHHLLLCILNWQESRKKKKISGYTFSRITQIFFSSNILVWKISHPSEKVNGLHDKNMHMLHLELLIVSILPHLISHSLILSLSLSLCMSVDFFFFFFLQLYFKKNCKPHGHLLFNLHHICSRIKPFSNKITTLTHLIKLTIIP